MSPAESLHDARLAVWAAHRAAQDVPDADIRRALDFCADALRLVVAAVEAMQREGASHAAA